MSAAPVCHMSCERAMLTKGSLYLLAMSYMNWTLVFTMFIVVSLSLDVDNCV